MFGRAVAVAIASRLASEAAFNAAPQYTIVGTPPEMASHFCYRPASPPRLAEPGSFEFFLVERYVLFSTSANGKLSTGTVVHEPYQISDVELTHWSDSQLPLNGFARRGQPPVHSAMCRGVDVDIYGLLPHKTQL